MGVALALSKCLHGNGHLPMAISRCMHGNGHLPMAISRCMHGNGHLPMAISRCMHGNGIVLYSPASADVSVAISGVLIFLAGEPLELMKRGVLCASSQALALELLPYMHNMEEFYQAD